MLIINKHPLLADTWEGPEGVRLMEVSLYYYCQFSPVSAS